MAITERWRNHIEAWQGSGLRQADYCRQHAINYRAFAARLSGYRGAGVAEKPLLVPVTVAEESAGAEPQPRTRVLTLKQGHRLEVPGAVSASWLAALLRGLG